MAQSTRTQLEALKETLIRSGGSGGKTTAADVRSMVTALIDSLINILDDENASGGYLKIDDDGRVDVTKINSATTPNSVVLQGNGTWRNMFVGARTFNGDGVTTTFQITHNAGFTPSFVLANSYGPDSAGDFYTTSYTPTTFNVEFLIAPAPGTSNVRINYALF